MAKLIIRISIQTTRKPRPVFKRSAKHTSKLHHILSLRHYWSFRNIALPAFCFINLVIIAYQITFVHRVLHDHVQWEDEHREFECRAPYDTIMGPQILLVLMFTNLEHIIGDLRLQRFSLASITNETKADNINSTPGRVGNIAVRAGTLKVKSYARLAIASGYNFKIYANTNWSKYWKKASSSEWMVMKLRLSNCMLKGNANFVEDISDKASSLKRTIRTHEVDTKTITVKEWAGKSKPAMSPRGGRHAWNDETTLSGQ